MTLFSQNARICACSRATKTIDAKVITGLSLFSCVSLTTGQRKPGLKISFQTQKDFTSAEIYTEVCKINSKTYVRVLVKIKLVLNNCFWPSVPLGSIQELPAKTCDEIKRSEGHAVSGKFWFSTIKSGTSVLAYCNMDSNGEFSQFYIYFYDSMALHSGWFWF